MSDIIKVSTAEMQATVTKYTQAQQTMFEAQKSMKAALDNLNACWKGVAYAALMYKWAQLEGNIAKSQVAIQRSIRALQNTINQYNETEETATSTGSGLDVGTQTTIYV